MDICSTNVIVCMDICSTNVIVCMDICSTNVIVFAPLFYLLQTLNYTTSV